MSRACCASQKWQAEAGLQFTPHTANLSLVTVFTLHLMGAIENPGPYAEFSIEGEDYYPWQVGHLSSLFSKSDDGVVQIPDGPGWGVEINPEWLKGAVYQISEMSGLRVMIQSICMKDPARIQR